MSGFREFTLICDHMGFVKPEVPFDMQRNEKLTVIEKSAYLELQKELDKYGPEWVSPREILLEAELESYKLCAEKLSKWIWEHLGSNYDSNVKRDGILEEYEKLRQKDKK